MNICGGLNFLPIIITLVCCGLLFVYFNARMSEIKYAVEKQNRVLTSFITNVQSDIRGGGGCGDGMNASFINPCDFASPEAIRAVEENDKVVVSDDDDSDSDSDSDSNSDSDSDIDSDESGDDEDKEIELHNVMNENVNGDVQVQVQVLAFEVLPHSENNDSSMNPSSITEITEETLNIENLENVENTENKSEDVNVMKVDDLRKVVVDKGLSSKEESKKLKKPELLSLLKK
jgi:hypothetical protein